MLFRLLVVDREHPANFERRPHSRKVTGTTFEKRKAKRRLPGWPDWVLFVDSLPLELNELMKSGVPECAAG
jgi:hypothetical protein